MMIAAALLAIVACSFRRAEAINCYDCQDGVENCRVNNANLNWYSRTCNGYCGYRCNNGVMTRICSTAYPAVDNAANVGRVITYENNLYTFCFGDQCNSGSFSCSSATAPTAATTTISPFTSQCYVCQDGVGTCTAGNPNMNLVGCNGYCGYKCSGGVQSRTCSSYYPAFDSIANVGKVLVSGSDLLFFCYGTQCNTVAFNCAAAAQAAAATTATPTTPIGGAVRASQCYDCQDGIGYCSSSNALLSWYLVPCTGYCGFKCSGTGVMTRTCSSYYPAVDNAANVGRVITYGTDTFSFCSGNQCNSGAFNCAGATATTVPTTAPTTTSIFTTTPAGTTRCYDCQEGVGYCTAGHANLNWYLGNCRGFCGYKCTNGVMTRTCSSYYPSVDATTSLGRVITVGSELLYFCSGAQCNAGAFVCPATGATTTPTLFPTTTTATTTTTTIGGVVRASICYICNQNVASCVAGSTTFNSNIVSCNGYCGYQCSGGVLSRTCSAYFPPLDTAANVNKVVNVGADLFIFCSGNLCNSGSVTCPASTGTTATTATTAATGTRSQCYDCQDGLGFCTSGNANLYWYSTPCTGFCGYKCNGATVQRVCSSGYTLPNLVIGTPFVAGGQKFQFCAGANCNSGTITCP